MSVAKCQLCQMKPYDPAHTATHAANVRRTLDYIRATYRRNGEPEPLCQDCGINTIDEMYWVWDQIWEEAHGDRFLCVGCLEKRLGRTLGREDFNCIWEAAVLVNYSPWFPRSERLKARIGIPDDCENFTALPTITRTDKAGGGATIFIEWD